MKQAVGVKLFSLLIVSGVSLFAFWAVTAKLGNSSALNVVTSRIETEPIDVTTTKSAVEASSMNYQAIQWKDLSPEERAFAKASKDQLEDVSYMRRAVREGPGDDQYFRLQVFGFFPEKKYGFF